MYTIFCRLCRRAGAVRFGSDARGRQRYRCKKCKHTFTRRTNTVRSGSQLSEREWQEAARLFALRAGISGADLGRFLRRGHKTGRKLNRAFRGLVAPLVPQTLAGPTEWDESVPVKRQWVVGGVSRLTRQCLMLRVENRSERTLVPLVERHTGAESLIFTDEWGGYIGLMNHWTVCHEREFVNPMARFVHTNTQEGIWAHLKPLGWHTYRGFPRATLPSYLAEFMFRYNLPSYSQRVSVLSALLSRKKINTLRV